MDRREIQAKGAQLQKAVAAKEPSSNIIAILNDLKTGIKPTEELLRATLIGKIVNKVKGIQGIDPSVSQLASEIIHRWRTTVNEQKVASGTSTPANGAKVNGNASAPSSKPSTPTPKAASPPSGIDPAKRTWKLDKVDMEVLPDKARNNCIGLLYDGLVQNTTFPAADVLAKATAIENAVFELPGADKSSTSQTYKVKIRSLYQNLRNKSNPGLRISVMRGKAPFTPYELVRLDADKLKSAEQQEEDQRLAKENMANAMVAQEERSVSTSLECGKCHEKKVSYTQAQTRSADEPMTTFCECLNCGNRWKFS
ncbi:transcription elongation factor S-II [Cyphellophora europaea CBS 101466]|uniref:Transcription elongation factor n=1 Tax=Cyphellophora europaea (strain CBS 101466) TaxID=1220924 RepID=W2RL12_CYPE1|nr:transcription elongation factor S-II [Cyphellophora europaea CBS 101466]ETN37015.1 transcription elongation factor S-II [Cyphellophora europaea CBS 101466]